ncbi:MAG: chromosomal replication initiator protein DnaA [Akkermansia sp.]
MTVQELWERMLTELRSHCEVGQYALDSLFSNLAPVDDNGTCLMLSYPASMMIDWVEVNYQDILAHAAARVLQAPRRIIFVPEGSALPSPCPHAEATPSAPGAEDSPAPRRSPKAQHPRRSMLNSGLNTDFTFENFIVGSTNSFAYAAAQAVANRSESSRLLFIHGESGLGKTHLLQAIGNAIRLRDDSTQVLYLTSETFMNDYIDAVGKKGDAIAAFRRKYRKADVLLIDDVQFLARTSKTQEEFFHTFNALFSSGKQIVLSADCPACAITSLEKRLVSRFEQGLTVSLLPPDYETRLAILRSRLNHGRNKLLTPEVIEFLATHITRSVRALEGALVQLTTYASFCNRTLSVADARAQLRDQLRSKRSGDSAVSIADIQQRVADEFNIRVADLNGRRRTALVAQGRQVAMYLARKHTGRSLQDIGAAFGGRDHGTVLHAERSIEQKMVVDTLLNERVQRLVATLI